MANLLKEKNANLQDIKKQAYNISCLGLEFCDIENLEDNRDQSLVINFTQNTRFIEMISTISSTAINKTAIKFTLLHSKIIEAVATKNKDVVDHLKKIIETPHNVAGEHIKSRKFGGRLQDIHDNILNCYDLIINLLQAIVNKNTNQIELCLNDLDLITKLLDQSSNMNITISKTVLFYMEVLYLIKFILSASDKSLLDNLGILPIEKTIKEKAKSMILTLTKLQQRLGGYNGLEYFNPKTITCEDSKRFVVEIEKETRKTVEGWIGCIEMLL